MVPLDGTFGGKFKRGKVVKIDPKLRQVTLEDGSSISYEILVLATGGYNEWPFKIGDASKKKSCVEYDNFAKKLRKANGVVLVGGGATGIETAAEIRSVLPEVNITVVHSSNVLLTPNISQECRHKVSQALRDMHINVILGERVDEKYIMEGVGGNAETTLVQTNKGRKLAGDVVIDCTGRSQKPQVFEKYLGKCINDRGQIIVNACLQVNGHENIFAIGDYNDVRENKLGYLAGNQGKHMGKSLENMLVKNGPPLEYRPGDMPFEMMLTLGPNLGMIYMKDGSYQWNEGYVQVKQKTLLNDIFWRDLNQSMTKDP